MKVAVAVITDERQRILITRRPLHASHGGMWEFPGGKLEKEEMAASALVREIKEEIGIDVKTYEYLGEIRHTYGHQPISLLIYHVQDYQGEVACCEEQMDLRWVDIENLKEYQFPSANLEIIELIKQKNLSLS